MRTVPAWGAADPGARLAPMSIRRRDPRADDVVVRIDFCGVCHSDVHTARGEWEGVHHPVVPGHEIVGRVAEVGAAVSSVQVGDHVAVGTLVDSCGTCSACTAGEENYCPEQVGTFDFPSTDDASAYTFGGYSREIVVRERFVLALPGGLDPAAAAPLLCAGATVYSPMRHWRVGAGSHLGVVGLGGLGGTAVRIAKALGAEVTVLSRTPAKEQDALRAGADRFVLSTDPDAMAAVADSMSLILSTVPRSHDLNPYLQLLRRDGTYVVLGAMEPLTTPVLGSTLAVRRVNIGGSLIAGLPETRELLELCAREGVAPDVRVVPVDRVNDAHDRVALGDPAFRYVLDLRSL
ncbi:MAG: hydroxyacid dehydrogenase [Nocardioides sp.]|nr:hydroxyacid dehydrogenase [Nocardioides sp.]